MTDKPANIKASWSRLKPCPYSTTKSGITYACPFGATPCKECCVYKFRMEIKQK